MPALTFSLTQEQYEALIEFARRGTRDDNDEVDTESARQLDEFLQSIEAANGVTRDGVWVQWQEMDQPLPADTDFPDKWPPELRHFIEFVTRRVGRADVDRALESVARKPVNVLVTRDPGARVGWTELDSFFV